MSPLEEIHEFFEALRRREPPRFADIPSDADARTRAFMEATRETSKKHWQMAIEALHNLEREIETIYEDSADDPARIEIIDKVLAIARRRTSIDSRFDALGEILTAEGKIEKLIVN